MLQKNKSQRIALIKYGLSAPLFILMLILSSATINNSKAIKLINKQAQKVLSAPAIETGFTKTTNTQKDKTDVKSIINVATENQPTTKTQADALKNDTTSDKKIFNTVDQAPEFPGGMQAFTGFLTKNIKYPEFMRKNDIQGQVVTSFVVETDGSLTDINVVRAMGNGADEEAIRVLKMSPKWNPGMQNGKPVRVNYTVPISFSLPPEVSFTYFDGLTGLKKDTIGKITGNTSIIGGENKAGNTLMINGPNNPLIIIDGKELSEMTPSEQKTMDPHDIVSINTLKDKSAIALYGPKAVNGVVIIKTRKKQP